VDRFTELWLQARMPRDATVGPERMATEALQNELLWLAALTRRELAAKVARVQADVRDLQEEAVSVTRRLAEAERALEELQQVAARREHEANDEPVGAAPDHEDPPRGAKAETAREAVLELLRELPDRRLTPQIAYDELRRRGRPFTRTAVQTALQRMAADGRLVRRVGAGAYQPVPDSAPTVTHHGVHEKPVGIDAPAAAANGRISAGWLTSQILQRVAEEAETRFQVQHPGTAESDALVAEAKRRVAVWIERHGRAPDDEAHLRRLMKTALHDHYRHIQRNGSEPRTNAEAKEEAE